jgi:hypothetical protein
MTRSGGILVAAALCEALELRPSYNPYTCYNSSSSYYYYSARRKIAGSGPDEMDFLN